MKIGLFDSGIGGLGLLKKLRPQVPQLEAYYISDLLYCPYGEKTQEDILHRCRYLTEVLLAKEVSLIAVACNTATALAIDQLRQLYPIPFVGVEPYLNFVHQWQNEGNDERKEVAKTSFKPVVLLTKASAQSKRFQNLQARLKTEGQVTVFPCEGLASLIENHLHQKSMPFFGERLQEILRPLKGHGFTHAILGCTHYPYVSAEIESFLNVQCISPEFHVAKRIIDLLKSPYAAAPASLQTQTHNAKCEFKTFYPFLHLAVTKEDPHLAAKLQAIFHEIP